MFEKHIDKKIEVLMVLDSFFPPDLRVRKEFTALLDAGYSVTLVCYRKKGQKKEETVLGCKVIRTSGAVSIFKKGILDIYNAIFFLNPLLQNELNKLTEHYDILHVHDLPPANTALRYGKKHKMRTVLDLHENYPEAVKIWFAWRKGFLVKLKNRIFFNYTRWVNREKAMVREFDSVLAVVDEMKNRLVETHGINENVVTVVSNAEPRDIFAGNIELEKIKDSNKIIYVGGIGPHRGLDTAIRGMAILQERGEDFQLVIVGSGNSDTVNHLLNISKQEKVSARVTFTGQLPFKEALSQMQTAFLNIIPHSRNGQTEGAVPHKLFQIMNSGYPLMVSSTAPLKRIVTDFKAGVVFEADDAIDFADKVIWADANREALQEFSDNAKDAVLNKGLNWETHSKNLIALYDSLSA